VNDNVDPVELSPTRAELIARVRSRGRQIRARRRLGVAGLTALVVLAIAAPTIAVGSRSSASHTVPPATAAARRGDFRIALVERATPLERSNGSGRTIASCAGLSDGHYCYELGRTVVSAADVQTAVVVYNATAGWIVNVTIDRPAGARLAALVNQQAAIIVGGRVVRAPTINPGITGTTVSVVSLATRAQAIALATKILGRAPSDGSREPNTPNAYGLSARLEFPVTTFTAGTTVHGTLIVENHTKYDVTVEKSGCKTTWEVTLTNARVPNNLVNDLMCSTGRTVFTPGTNRLPFDVITTYSTCTEGNASPRIVRCLPNRGEPLLPAGEYHAVLDIFSEGERAFPSAPDVLVQLVAAH
jgi:hypothetical protein